jgi:hypothetical protein
MNGDEYGAWINVSGKYVPVPGDHIETAYENDIPCELYDAFMEGWVRVVWGKYAALQGTRDAIRTIWPKIAKRLLRNAASVSIDFSGPFDGRDFDLPIERKEIARWIMNS